MANEDIEVETTVTVPTEDAAEDSTTEVAADHVIDAAIDSGIAAEHAVIAADGAYVAAIDADIAADDAARSAGVAVDAVDRLDGVVARLEHVAQLQAQAAAAQATDAAADQVTELDTPEVNPELDIEPESSHWLTRKWNLFGKKD